MVTLMITMILCLVFWGICFLNTGGDDKNIKAYGTYPDEVQKFIRHNSELSEKMKKVNILVSPDPFKTFLSNTILFLVVLFILGFMIRTDRYDINFVRLLVMGEGLNLFDYFIIDLLWWRNTKRIRFTGTENNKEMYRDPKKHTLSFLKGIIMFMLIALIDAALLLL